MTGAGILFLCAANSARSQIAEGLARALAPDGGEVFSAGSSPSRLHPFVVRVLDEVDVDTSRLYAKGIDGVPTDKVSTVVTLCAANRCPQLAGEVERLHWPVEDPTAGGGGDQAVLDAFRGVRDTIRARLVELFRDESS